jgi:hypothetical protein
MRMISSHDMRTQLSDIPYNLITATGYTPPPPAFPRRETSDGVVRGFIKSKRGVKGDITFFMIPSHLFYE